ncbi:MAG: sulfur carrier protein ThiS [Coxiella endosymbiont of Dermacentor nuttalli]
MINIYLNGEPISIYPQTTLKNLLINKDFSGIFAVAINEAIINCINYETTIIHAGDRVEVITAMCGG